jgi:hypothetical protein
LSAFCVGLTASRAIRGATLAGDNVKFSPRDSIEVTKPAIVVSITGGDAKPEGRDIADADAHVGARIELYVPMDMRIESGPAILEASSSSSGELVLCAMWNQCVYALQAADGLWPDLFRRFVNCIFEITATSTVYETKAGSHINARLIELKVGSLSEPIAGLPATGAWAQLLDALTASADPESLALEGFLRSLIELNTTGPWQVVSSGLALSPSELGEVGDGSLDYLAREPKDR